MPTQVTSKERETKRENKTWHMMLLFDLIWFFSFGGIALFFFEDVAGRIKMVHRLAQCMYGNGGVLLWRAMLNPTCVFPQRLLLYRGVCVFVSGMDGAEEKQIQRRKYSTRDNFPLAQTNFRGMIWVTRTLACLSILICLFLSPTSVFFLCVCFFFFFCVSL